MGAEASSAQHRGAAGRGSDVSDPEFDEASLTPEEELRAQQERELTQYLSYHYDIAVCLELCQIYESRAGEWEDTDDLRIALVQNIVVAYCRPFMRSRDKLGSHALPKDTPQSSPSVPSGQSATA